jgi:hypothetical protein
MSKTFAENHAFYVEKYGTVGEATDDSMAPALCVLDK